jgi:hypothetical protein
VGLLDRLDALDRRTGFGGVRSSHPWSERRPPYPLIAAGTLTVFEAVSFIRLVMDGTTSGPWALAYLPLGVAAFVLTVIPLYSQRRWGLGVLIGSQFAVAVRVVYRSIGNPSRAAGLLYIAAVIGLLTLPPSSRRFYRGEWSRRS